MKATRAVAPCDEPLPALAPAEIAWVETYIGHKLTSDEAQLLLQDASLVAAFNVWLQEKSSAR